MLAPARTGGLETVVLSLATAQQAAAHRVHIAALVSEQPDIHPFVRTARQRGLSVDAIATHPRAYLAQRARLHVIRSHTGAEIVHSHGYLADVLAATLTLPDGTARVTTVHGFTGGDWRNEMYERLQRLSFRRFDAVVAVSRTLAGQLEPRCGRRLHVSLNAVGTEQPPLDAKLARRQLGLSTDPTPFRIGWIGRLSMEKGPDVMVRALALLDDVPVSLSIVGDGPESSTLLSLARSLNVEQRIVWHGVVESAGRLLRAFDLVVLSSRTEGTPMVLLEAMACGCPVVATRVGGIPDVVDATEGLLVPPAEPAALASAIRSTLSNPLAARDRADAASRRVARDFSMTSWRDRYDTIYEAALGRRTRTYA